MVKEFKQFALRGNLIDMAVAFVMGAAFGKVVSAFIDGMVLPLVGLIQGRDFSNLYYPLSEKVRLAREIAEADGSGLSLDHAKEIGPVIAYGTFITVTIEFVIISFFIVCMGYLDLLCYILNLCIIFSLSNYFSTFTVLIINLFLHFLL